MITDMSPFFLSSTKFIRYLPDILFFNFYLKNRIIDIKSFENFILVKKHKLESI